MEGDDRAAPNAAMSGIEIAVTAATGGGATTTEDTATGRGIGTTTTAGTRVTATTETTVGTAGTCAMGGTDTAMTAETLAMTAAIPETTVVVTPAVMTDEMGGTVEKEEGPLTVAAPACPRNRPVLPDSRPTPPSPRGLMGFHQGRPIRRQRDAGISPRTAMAGAATRRIATTETATAIVTTTAGMVAALVTAEVKEVVVEAVDRDQAEDKEDTEGKEEVDREAAARHWPRSTCKASTPRRPRVGPPWPRRGRTRRAGSRISSSSCSSLPLGKHLTPELLAPVEMARDPAAGVWEEEAWASACLGWA